MVGPELFEDIQGSCVVAGTCLLRKLPLAVDAISEPFPMATLELTLDSNNPPRAVPFLLSKVLASTVMVSLAVILKFDATVELKSPLGTVEIDLST